MFVKTLGEHLHPLCEILMKETLSVFQLFLRLLHFHSRLKDGGKTSCFYHENKVGRISVALRENVIREIFTVSDSNRFNCVFADSSNPSNWESRFN